MKALLIYKNGAVRFEDGIDSGFRDYREALTKNLGWMRNNDPEDMLLPDQIMDEKFFKRVDNRTGRYAVFEEQ